ncbi:MAG: endonuclease/exonuclease/phosphatase family protein [Candidatus Sericytochromatia bacterium]|nr:endonuclease/exonuclease/phosphatase family protein [Candidatus Sericytochromatia bacterium]
MSRLALFNGRTPGKPDSPHVVRALTLNVAGLEREWFQGRAERLCAGLTAVEPDLVFLQETGIRGGTDCHDQAAWIGEWLGLNAWVFVPYGNPEEQFSPEQGGIAILSRWPLLSVEERRLPPGLQAPDHRTALLASVAHPAGTIHTVSTHLSWRENESTRRHEQVVALLDRAQDKAWMRHGARFILAGDLNATEDETCVTFLREHLQDAYRQLHPGQDGFTWDRDNPYAGNYPSPSRRLDYIFVDHACRVLASGRALHTPTWVASDHYAVWADLTWPEETEALTAG